MEDERFSALLRQALNPVYQADMETNDAILERIAIRENALHGAGSASNGILKLAGLILVSVLVCGSAAYAGGRIYNDIMISKHSISVGKATNTTPDDLAKADYVASETVIAHEEGAKDDLWNEKDVKSLEELTTICYFYDDYEKALCDTGLETIFSDSLESYGNVQYAVSEREGRVVDFWLIASFLYQNGRVRLFEYTDQKQHEGLLEGDSFGLSLILEETGNVRNYTSVTGREYTLVDSGEKTYVCVSRDQTVITLTFEELEDEEICRVLDMVIW